MRTSEDSRREQADRFLSMAQKARVEGNLGLAHLLLEAARRAFETYDPPLVPAEADMVEQQPQDQES